MPKLNTKATNKRKKESSRPPSSRRRSLRSTESQIQTLAAALHETTRTTIPSTTTKPTSSSPQQQQRQRRPNNNRILIFTGAGVSVNSGIQPFRGKDGLWSQTLWTNATRTSFRKDPLRWYNHFWLPHFPPSLNHHNTATTNNSNNNSNTTSNSDPTTITTTTTNNFNNNNTNIKNNNNNIKNHDIKRTNHSYYKPNAAHDAIAKLCNVFHNMCVITQNVDGLHCQTTERWNWEERLVECHGRLGLFKCLPNSDSDTSDDETDSDDEEKEEEDDDNDNDRDGEMKDQGDEAGLGNGCQDNDGNGSSAGDKGYEKEKYKRLVKLGSLRKRREWKKRYERGQRQQREQEKLKQHQRTTRTCSNSTPTTNRRRTTPCRYEMEESIPSDLICPMDTRRILSGGGDSEDHSEHSSPSEVPVELSSGDNSATTATYKKRIKCEPSTVPTTCTISNSRTTAPSTLSTLPEIVNEDVAIVSMTGSEEDGEGGRKRDDNKDDDDDDDDDKPEDNKRITRGQIRRQQQEGRQRQHQQRRQQRQIDRKRQQQQQQQQQQQRLPPPLDPKQLKTPPTCPSCSRPIAPQALLFDEGYHSHSHYQFEKMEEWISTSAIILFIGTSFAVNITDVALEHARVHGIPVWNFNVENGDLVEGRGRLDVENVVGDVGETLPALWSACCGADGE